MSSATPTYIKIVAKYARFDLHIACMQDHVIIITSDMQGLVWGEPEFVHEYDFDDQT